MSTWKKIIVSGSGAHLSSVTASNGSIISGSLTMSGSITNVDNIDFNTTPPQSLIASVAGRLSWDNGARDLVIGAGNNVDVHVGQQEWAYVKNSEATTLNKGEIVFISGSSGNTITVKRANDSGDPTSAGTLGMVGESIASGAEGLVLVNGLMRKLDTTGFTAGKLLFLSSTPGAYTETPPTAPSHSVRIGYVVKVDASQGEIYVKVDNGYEIGELHDIIDGTTTTSYGDLLVKSGSVWKNSKQLSGSYGLTGSLQATSFTGSLQGTASYSIQSLSSSFAQNSSTASYVLNAVSSSFATTASYVSGMFSLNNPGDGRLLISDGTTDSATASANLYLDGTPTQLVVSASLFVSGTATFDNDLTVNDTLAVDIIRPLDGTLLISGSVYHNSGSFVYTPTFVDYQEKFTTVGIVGNAVTLDLDNGNVFDLTINSAISTFTISNPPFGGNAGSFVLVTTGTGTAYPIIWPASVSWPGGTPPTVTSTNGQKDVYGFISLDQGTNWYGFIGGQNI